MRVVAGMCSATKSVFAHAVPQKGADADGYTPKSIWDSIACLGHARVVVRSDNEPAIVKLVTVATNLLKLRGEMLPMRDHLRMILKRTGQLRLRFNLPRVLRGRCNLALNMISTPTSRWDTLLSRGW